MFDDPILVEPLLVDPMPSAPQKPGPAECCEGGCDRCVFELYAEALERYRLALRDWQARQITR